MSSINIVSEIPEMVRLAAGWSFSADVALVPTMGYLHDGHLKLIEEARSNARIVIVSVFVNPLQFGPNEDFDRYPRSYERDIELLINAGVDVVFIPKSSDFTPPGMMFTITPGAMAEGLCGAYRPGHFEGVCTIVMKLFQAIRPGQAFFGWKDAQQFLILSRMVNELNVPVLLHAVETIRDADGLAMSSRNTYLTDEERAAAPVLYRGLINTKASFNNGVRTASELLAVVRETVSAEPAMTLQYVELVDSHNLAPVTVAAAGNVLALAAFAGKTRLIDNVRL